MADFGGREITIVSVLGGFHERAAAAPSSRSLSRGEQASTVRGKSE
jgi:hypothetical protein